jgi:hypothetical protein
MPHFLTPMGAWTGIAHQGWMSFGSVDPAIQKFLGYLPPVSYLSACEGLS